jgi:hypothetical protein
MSLDGGVKQGLPFFHCHSSLLGCLAQCTAKISAFAVLSWKRAKKQNEAGGRVVYQPK